ncbi:hypothetical protein [Roseovarius aestuariivivens]|nr:hypothetical protein [Roseovarius aestuariivivens]
MALLMKARENRLTALARLNQRATCAIAARARRPEGPALFLPRRAA